MAKKQTQKEKYEELVKKVEELESENKNKKSKKKKLIIALSVTVPVLLIGATTTAIVLTSSKTQSWTFTQEDYINLRKSIIQSNITLEQLENNLLEFFKTNLKASNKNISSLIKNVTISKKIEKVIIFKVTLETKNNNYSCIEDEKFYITNNELTIEYSGNNSIDFKK